MPQPEAGTSPQPTDTAVTEPTVPPADAARKASRILGVLASLSLVIAVAVNILIVPDARQALPGPALEKAAVPGVPGDLQEAKFEKPAVEFLPSRILQFETIARQPIPGRGDGAGEAVYKTLNMNLEAQISVVIYARTEEFTSAAQAKARFDEMMKPYSTNTKQAMVEGVTPATVAESADGGALVTGWVRGNTATMVKASFAAWTPPGRRIDLLQKQHDQVVSAVDVFQRTGREGVSK